MEPHFFNQLDKRLRAPINSWNLGPIHFNARVINAKRIETRKEMLHHHDASPRSSQTGASRSLSHIREEGGNYRASGKIHPLENNPRIYRGWTDPNGHLFTCEKTHPRDMSFALNSFLRGQTSTLLKYRNITRKFTQPTIYDQ